MRKQDTRDFGIAFFYCDRARASDEGLATDIVKSVVFQLARQCETCPPELLAQYKLYKGTGIMPLLEDMISLLRSLCAYFKDVWVCIDALDELPPVTRDLMITSLMLCQDVSHVVFFSRPQIIEDVDAVILFDLSAHSSDLETLIRATMKRKAIASQRLQESDAWPDFVNDTVIKLTNLAQGMFILVAFQLRELLRPRTISEMRRTLNSTSGQVDEYYRLTVQHMMERETGMFTEYRQELPPFYHVFIRAHT